MEPSLTNLDFISLAFNFIGTIVIVLSLLYLAKQTYLTNKIAQGESEREMFNTFNELLIRYSDYDSIDLIQRAYSDYNALTNKEKARFNLIYLIPHLNNCEQFYQLHKLKLISDERLTATTNIGIAILNTNGGKEGWIELQHAYNPEFVKFINLKVEESEIPAMSEILTWLKVEPNNTKSE